MYSPATSLADPPADSAIADAILWVQGAALGTSATAIGVLAVAAIGLLMLTGRLELRRGVTVVLGCFILFGAGGIAQTVMRLPEADSQRGALGGLSTTVAPRPPPTTPPSPSAYDPYAGASVPSAR